MMSCLLLRAQHDAGLWQRSRRTLDWLAGVQGAENGGLVRGDSGHSLDGVHLRHRSLGRGNVCQFVVRHLLGIRFVGPRLVLNPHSIRTARRWRPICGFARAG